MPAPLTACILTKNEGANIARCLQSLQGLAAEVVLVDSGSTDRTREIAGEFGARVVDQPWRGMSGQRAFSLEQGTRPWVLALDADEELSPELAAEIHDFLASEPKENGATFPRLTKFMNRWIRHGDWYPDVKLRLVRRGAARVTGGAGHDRIELDGPLKRLSADLHHYSFRDLPHYVTKMSGFAQAFETENPHANHSLLAIVFRPWWRFFRAYFLKLGFLDGFAGFWVAVSTAYFTFLRYSLSRDRKS